MSANNLTEILVDLVEAQIKANIATALTEVKTARNDALVSMEPPQSYFIYSPAYGYRTPAVFIIADNIDFRLGLGQNHINAKHKINVAVVIEDKDAERLTIKAYRYQAALNKVLEQVSLSDTGNTVQYIVKVIRAEYSSLYTNAQKPDDPMGVFRKEVLLELEVENFENY